MRERVMRMFKRGLCFLTAAVFLLLTVFSCRKACADFERIDL